MKRWWIIGLMMMLFVSTTQNVRAENQFPISTTHHIFKSEKDVLELIRQNNHKLCQKQGILSAQNYTSHGHQFTPQEWQTALPGIAADADTLAILLSETHDAELGKTLTLFQGRRRVHPVRPTQNEKTITTSEAGISPWEAALYACLMGLFTFWLGLRFSKKSIENLQVAKDRAIATSNASRINLEELQKKYDQQVSDDTEAYAELEKKYTKLSDEFKAVVKQSHDDHVWLSHKLAELESEKYNIKHENERLEVALQTSELTITKLNAEIALSKQVATTRNGNGRDKSHKTGYHPHPIPIPNGKKT